MSIIVVQRNCTNWKYIYDTLPTHCSVLLDILCLSILSRQFSPLPDGQEGSSQSLGQLRSEKESSSVQTYYCIDLDILLLLSGNALTEFRQSHAENVVQQMCDERFRCHWISKDRENVAEVDALLREVWVELCRSGA